MKGSIAHPPPSFYRAQTNRATKSGALANAQTHPFNPLYTGLNKMFRMPSMKKGGKVKKTGPHLLHKGERVLTKKQSKKFDKKKFNKARMSFAKGN